MPTWYGTKLPTSPGLVVMTDVLYLTKLTNL